MAQLAMAWVISNPDVSTAITGATRPEQLIDTVKAIQVLPKLTVEIQKRIEDIFKTEPKGKRNMITLGPEVSRRKIVLGL
jgi:aryl-alcohol dehydrogenase-like predicted oxidoreductase